MFKNSSKHAIFVVEQLEQDGEEDCGERGPVHRRRHVQRWPSQCQGREDRDHRGKQIVPGRY